MDVVMDTTLVKWGNGQGFRVPKEACELLGIGIGARAKVTVDAANSQLLLTFEKPQRKFHRTRKLSIEELFEGYDGAYTSHEIDWGEDVGNEVVI